MRTRIDAGMLGAALIGYQRQLEQIKMKMDEIRGHLRGRMPVTINGPVSASRHHISAAGRARIAAAQRKRWAAARKRKAA